MTPVNTHSGTTAPNMSVSFVNVCSLVRKVSEVRDFLAHRGIHILGMAETWLKPSVTDGELLIPNYRLYRRDRDTRHGGGVGIYCHDSLRVRRRSDLEHPQLEIIWIDVIMNSETIVVGCCYRPPHMPVSYWDEFERNVSAACEGRHTSTVLIGDLNVDCGNPTSAGAQQLFSICAMYGLTNYVSSPTRVTAQSATMIDVFLSTSAITGPCETVHLDLSDHHAVLARLPVVIDPPNAPPGPGVSRKTRKLHKVNWETFNSDLAQNFSTVPERDIPSMVDQFNAAILQVLNRHAPLVSQRKRHRRPCPWLTQELVDAVRKRNRLHQQLMRDKQNETLRQQHRSARKQARQLDRRLRNAYFTSQCATTDQRKLWKIMNAVSGRIKERQSPQVPTDDLSRAFADVVRDDDRPRNLVPPQGPTTEIGFSTFQPVTVDDVRKCLRAVDPHKAMGSDEIPGMVLSMCATVLAVPLAAIVNASLSAGNVPPTFKLSHVSPLFKAGDPTLPKNYRPVSLLPVVSRILEYFVKQQLMNYLNENSLLPESQFAYRRCHSTEDAVVCAVNRWQLAKSDRKYTGVVMVDMSKAFDRVRHVRLINVLFGLGVSGAVLQWFVSYLSDRTQCVRIGDELSNPSMCTRGVPQGSVLGPLLFILYTRDICHIIKQPVLHQEFADDIILDYSNSDPNVVCTKLTNALTCLANWLGDIGLLLNASKTQVMMLPPRGAPATSTPYIVKCNGIVLEITRVAKYLGVIIDSELSWSPHIEHLSRKSAQVTGQLWRHGQSLTLRARRMWYLAMIQSSLLYSSNAFYPGMSKGLVSRVVKLSKAGIRAIFRVRPHTETSPLLIRLRIRPLMQVLCEKLVMFVYRCIHSNCSTLFAEYFTPTLSATDHGDLPVTRGQCSNLLRIPFLPNQSGRRTIQFVASTLWNALPPHIRSERNVAIFKCSVSNIDLPAILA